MKSCPIPPPLPYDETRAFPGIDSHGMTLRDYFAGQVIGETSRKFASCTGGWEAAALVAYGIADAMLAARTTETIAR
jgi:hypothetical protein